MLNFLKKLFGGGDDLSEVIKRKALILDVRSTEEFSGGHATGAVNIPLQILNSKMNDLKKKNVPIITCCASGRRSGLAAQQMKKLGIEVYNGGPWQNVQRYL